MPLISVDHVRDVDLISRNLRWDNFQRNSIVFLARFAVYKKLPLACLGVRRWFEVAVETLRDRKSTRLNSSHTVISYAVFCLKKKKKNKNKYVSKHATK